MDNSEDREKIVKEIAKASDSIHKKYRALKTGKMEEDIALKRHFKPIIDLLKQIIENTVKSFKASYYDWNILFGRRRGTKIQKKTTECFVRQSYIGFHACEINVELKTIPSTLNEVSEII